MNNILDKDNDQNEKEELTRYNIKQKQKAKKKINFILNIVLFTFLFFIIIYILNLKKKLAKKELEIQYLTNINKEYMLSLNATKSDIDKMNKQNHIVQDKAFSMLSKCFNETESLNNEINSLKEEINQNEIINKQKLDELIKKNRDLRDKIKYIDEYYNIC